MTDQTQDVTQPKEVDQTPASASETVTVTVQQMEQAIEAILFAAGYPIAYEKLSAVIGLPPHEVRNLVAHMAEAYADRGIQLLLYPDTCQLCTREEFAPYVREALGIRRGGNLSASSMEVLAVVAYNQPVTRAYIDTIRGVDSSYAVSSLLDKGLIEAVGRLDAPGRPTLFGTTEKFLRVFGLNSLAELPETEALSAADAKEALTDESADPPAEDAPASSETEPSEGGEPDGAV